MCGLRLWCRPLKRLLSNVALQLTGDTKVRGRSLRSLCRLFVMARLQLSSGVSRTTAFMAEGALRGPAEMPQFEA